MVHDGRTNESPFALHLPFVDVRPAPQSRNGLFAFSSGWFSRALNAFDESGHPITTYDGGGAVATNERKRTERRLWCRERSDRRKPHRLSVSYCASRKRLAFHPIPDSATLSPKNATTHCLLSQSHPLSTRNDKKYTFMFASKSHTYKAIMYDISCLLRENTTYGILPTIGPKGRRTSGR